MAIRVLMVDVDGVVVMPDRHGWSVNLDRDLGLSRDTLQAEFFAPHFHDVVHGRARLRDRLGPVLLEHAPHLNCVVDSSSTGSRTTRSWTCPCWRNSTP